MSQLDDYLYQELTKIVVKWVKKNKYKKHKYDFFIMVHGWEIAYWVVAIMYMAWQTVSVTHHYWVTGFFAVFGSLLVFLEYLRYKDFSDMKQWYDTLWLQRKNPVIYNSVKEVSSEIFQKNKKTRIFSIQINLFAILWMAFLNPVLVPIYVFSTVFLYTNVIFDFDEPDEKKKATDSVTDKVKEAWENLIRGLKPALVGSGS